eukprot:TRINITY_DN1552_c0_g1_i1.p1 TRINITY_DN1552_c0_g1~~TRINITY_DN1552_c0_g1_i1.p1  ORF type:complete len:1041 (+),score=211.67 TRINITY_DN1552_c0_g1_i1:72-3125(+)
MARSDVVCGDGICNSPETFNCPSDCDPTCGDGVCARNPLPPNQYDAETAANCAIDCNPTCGDGVCARNPISGVNETIVNCAKDCNPTCGDGVCAKFPFTNIAPESYQNCPQDCNPTCGNYVCEGLESCVTCPKDCGCKFDGGLLTVNNCLPNLLHAPSACPQSKVAASLPAFADIGRPASAVTVSYFSYLRLSPRDSGNYMFLINATNGAARLFINDKKLIDAWVSQDVIFSMSRALLPVDIIHKIELQYYSNAPTGKLRKLDLMWRDLNNPTSTFATVNQTVYSWKTCGDNIIDSSAESDWSCPTDFANCRLASCRNATDCGDGLCLEQSIEDCFIDCHPLLTSQCSSIASKPGFLSQGLPIESDTLGELIRNQMLWHLPGLEQITYGVNIVTGSSAQAPLFYFGYCSDNIGQTIQDTYRETVYTIPSEIYAQPTPKCQYNAKSTSFSSSVKLANSFAESSSLDISAKGDVDIFGVEIGASFGYSQETSVKISREMETKRSGSMIFTELTCATSKIQMAKYTFHPAFLADLAKVNSTEGVVKMIDKYGTHFYDSATLGGRLRQITSVSSVFASSKTSSELEKHAQLSFGASVSSPIFSVSGDFYGSIDSTITTEQQQEFEEEATHSSVITYGGPPGSFGPSSSDAPSNFGDWASSVDLLPVPIEYRLKKISDIIPSSWKSVNGSSLYSLWVQGESIWKQSQKSINEVDSLNHYSLYWHYPDTVFSYNNNEARPKTETFVFTATNASSGTVVESITLMDQSGPSGSYSPFQFYQGDLASVSPIRFELFTPFNLTGLKFNITSLGSALQIINNENLNGIHKSDIILLDWSTGLATNFDNKQLATSSGTVKWYTSVNRDTDPLAASKFYWDIQITDGELAPAGDDETFYEVTVYHSAGKRVFLFDVKDSNVPRNASTQIKYIENNSPTANAFGYPYKIAIRLGSKRTNIAGPISATITNFWVQANYCPGGVGNTNCTADTDRQRQVFGMEPGSSVEISNFDKDPAIIPVKRLNEWASLL